MRDGFTVDPGELENAGQDAQALTDALRARVDGTFTGTAAFGHAGLRQAVDAFHARAREGMARFAAAGDSVASRLAATAAAYREADRAGADGFNSIGGGNA